MEITVSTQVKERAGDAHEPLSSFSSKILLISEVSTPISPHEAFSDVSVSSKLSHFSTLTMFCLHLYYCPKIMLSCGIIRRWRSSTPGKVKAPYEQGWCLTSRPLSDGQFVHQLL